ncbi:hypothetical protein ACR784_09410 [Sphingobacterium multivorum]|uniref:hypothetical protein n=1 Tax=Sphingobacterium multivorum TaxID=28454 RepID=UPI003DA32003
MKMYTVGVTKLIISILILFCLFISCKKENKTEAPTNITVSAITGSFEKMTQSSIVLHGAVGDVTMLPNIIEYGFVLSTNGNTGYAKPESEIVLGKKLSEKDVVFTYKPEDNFDMNTIYTYAFYVKTKNGFYKGTSNSFQLDGMQVESPSEILGMPGEQVSLKGRFSMLDDSYKLYGMLDRSQQIAYQIAADGSSLTFKIPDVEGSQHGKKLRIELQKNSTVGSFNRQLVQISLLGKLIPPAIESYSFTDLIHFYGACLPGSGGNDKSFQIIIGNITIPYTHEIAIKDLKGLVGKSFKIGYKNGRDSVLFATDYSIQAPNAADIFFVNPVAHPNTHAIVNGFSFYSFFDMYQTKYYVGKYQVNEMEVNGDYPSGAISIPLKNIPEGQYKLRLDNGFFNIESTKTIQIKKFDWTAIDKKEAYVGDYLTLTGNFIKGFEYTIYGDDFFKLPVVCAEDGKLTFQVQTFFEETESLHIVYNELSETGWHLYTHEKALPFKSLGMTFDSLSPKMGLPGSIVQLKGKGIGLAHMIRVGDTQVYPLVKSVDEVTIAIPVFLTKGKVRISASTWRNTVLLSPDYFEVQ